MTLGLHEMCQTEQTTRPPRTKHCWRRFSGMEATILPAPCADLWATVRATIHGPVQSAVQSLWVACTEILTTSEGELDACLRALQNALTHRDLGGNPSVFDVRMIGKRASRPWTRDRAYVRNCWRRASSRSSPRLPGPPRETRALMLSSGAFAVMVAASSATCA
jgi:hypothetical protein